MYLYEYADVFFWAMVVAVPLACAIWFVKGGIAAKIFTAPILLASFVF